METSHLARFRRCAAAALGTAVLAVGAGLLAGPTAYGRTPQSARTEAGTGTGTQVGTGQPSGRLDVAYDDGAGRTRTYRLTCAPPPHLADRAENAETAGAHANPGNAEAETAAPANPAPANPVPADPAPTSLGPTPTGTPTSASTETPASDTTPCAHLSDIGGPVPTTPPGRACSMIYGGPQTADVTGTWEGRAVKESYRRTNGCEVARWNRMVPALPNPVADAAHHEAAPVQS